MWYKIYSVISYPIDKLCIALVWLYKIFISPLKPKTCAYAPTCSVYMIQAISEFHFFSGIILGLKRLVRCSPKHKGGVDLVPDNIRGKLKFLI